MDEQKLELRAKEKAKERYRATVSHYKENKEETETAVGRLSLSRLTPYVEQELNTWKDNAGRKAGRGHAALPLLSALPAETAALLISRSVLNSITTVNSITALHLSIGTALSQEIRLEAFRVHDPRTFNMIQKSTWDSRSKKRQNEYLLGALRKQMTFEANAWTVDEKLRAGAVGLELFIMSTGVVEVQTSYDARRKRNRSVVVPTEAMVKWLENAHAFREELRPMYTPMVVEPVKWVTPEVGGYIHTPLTLIKSQRDQSELTPEVMPKVYEAINRVQNTGWAVNSKMLEVVQHLYKNNISVPGLPMREPIPFPTIPTDIKTNDDARKAYGAEKARVIATNNKMKNRKLTVARLLHQANEFNGVEEFFLPQQLDFRGRMYSVPIGLNNQGDDLSRGLLQFSKGKPLDVAQHDVYQAYMVKGANHYGHSNLTLEQRVDWVVKNARIIAVAGEDPLNHMSFWTDAKEPFQFLAWITEYSAILKDHRVPSYLPCHVDGTNNGCQIWALIRRDEATGSATNCNYSETPQDLYQAVADDVVSQLDDGFYSQEWRRIGIDRGTVKGAVMIVPYSATLQGVAHTIMAWLDKQREDGLVPAWNNDFAGANFLAQQIWKVLPAHIPAVLEGKDFLQECANHATAQGKAIKWTTPTGLEVTNLYFKKTARKVRTNLGQRYHVSYVQEPTPEISSRRQRQTITANFTHSYDAALMVETICHATDVSHFSMVHDSYGCHAADLPKLAKAVRKSAATLFDRDVLAEFRNGLCEQLPEAMLPEPPKLGNMLPTSVLTSLYFFN